MQHGAISCRWRGVTLVTGSNRHKAAGSSLSSCIGKAPASWVEWGARDTDGAADDAGDADGAADGNGGADRAAVDNRSADSYSIEPIACTPVRTGV